MVQLAHDHELRDFLLIGGNAVIAYGVPRFTRDVDLVIPERDELAWRSMMGAAGFEMIHGTQAFVQFLDFDRIKPRVDLMIVDESTWGKSSAKLLITSHSGAPSMSPSPNLSTSSL